MDLSESSGRTVLPGIVRVADLDLLNAFISIFQCLLLYLTGFSQTGYWRAFTVPLPRKVSLDATVPKVSPRLFGSDRELLNQFSPYFHCTPNTFIVIPMVIDFLKTGIGDMFCQFVVIRLADFNTYL